MVSLVDFYAGVERMYGGVMVDDAENRYWCPYCKDRIYLDYVEGSARLVDDRIQRVEAAFQCIECNRFVIGGRTHAGVGNGIGINTLYRNAPLETIEKSLLGRVEYWEPVSPVGKSYDDVPSEISGPADEAYRCLSIEANRAAVLLARGVIEAAAKLKGVTSGTLYKKIEQLGADGHVRNLIVEAAHEVRLVGNDMAHGDFATTSIDSEDAEEVLGLMDEVIDEVFALPSRIARRRSRRSQSSAM